MAEEIDEIVDAGPKRNKMVMIAIILLLLAILGGGGYYAYINFFQKSPEEEKGPEGKADDDSKADDVKSNDASEALKNEKAPPQPRFGIMVPMEPFIVNLAKSRGQRFLKVSVTLELSSAEVSAEINENIQKITDSILILLSSKTFENVYSVQGKFKLKDEITTRVNRFLVLGHVKDAYFTEFVIQ